MTQDQTTHSLAEPLTTAERVQLAQTESDRWIRIVDGFSVEDWQRPSGCEGWTVADLVRHLIGQAEQLSSFRAAFRQSRAGKKLARGHALIDGITEHQVASRAQVPPTQLATDLGSALPRAAKARERWPRTSTRLGMKIEVPRPSGIVKERWTFAYMSQVMTRDLWMHRVDLDTARVRLLEPTPDHDGRIVADVVADWSRRHGGPFDLTLTGPAGGHWRVPGDGPAFEQDAIKFCQGLFGRAPAPPYDVVVPF
jgi:uncharacterized protein (TIGR03083 family)